MHHGSATGLAAILVARGRVARKVGDASTFAAVAAIIAPGLRYVVREDGRRHGRRSEAVERTEAAGDAGRAFRHGVGAGQWPFPLELLVDLRLDCVDAEVLPAMFDLDICKGEPVLQSPGHLFTDEEH